MMLSRRIKNRIQKLVPGTVFTPDDFADLGSPHAVGMTLTRLMRNGGIRRVARGIYDVPKQDKMLGALSADTDAIAQALANRHKMKLQPTGAYAANLLGLSEQLPMKVAYLTDGTPRTIKIGKRQIILKHTTPRQMAAAGKVSGLFIQALRWLGQRHVTTQTLKQLQQRLDATAKRQLLKDAHLAPVWVANWMRQVATDQL